MSAFTDLALLAGLLREAPKTLVDEKEQGDISPYLLETILPMLVNGNYPRLRDIDFEQFELYDPPELVGYMEKRDRSRPHRWRTGQLGTGSAVPASPRYSSC